MHPCCSWRKAAAAGSCYVQKLQQCRILKKMRETLYDVLLYCVLAGAGCELS
jgi:hypothetical protein